MNDSIKHPQPFFTEKDAYPGTCSIFLDTANARVAPLLAENTKLREICSGIAEENSRILQKIAYLTDSLRYCERRSDIELNPLVAPPTGDEAHYHAVLRKIRDAARMALGIQEE
jgi:hypothetical protein